MKVVKEFHCTNKKCNWTPIVMAVPENVEEITCGCARGKKARIKEVQNESN